MHEATKTDIPHIAEFMRDLWTYTKTYWNAEDTQTYHDAMYKAAHELDAKYKHDSFVQSMLIACVTAFASKARGEWK